MVAQLAIRYITDANAAWARTDLGPLDDLELNIKRNGIRRPLLVQEDFLMLDGARRLVAASNAGLSTVPIIICHTWSDVLEHLKPIEPDCRPMDWPDLVDYWGITLKGLQNKHQRLVAGKTRRSNLATRTDGSDANDPVGDNTYSRYTHELATLYNVSPSTIKLLRDYIARLRRMKSKFPLLYSGLFSRFPTGEDARELVRSRYIKSLIERVRREEITEEEALSIYDIRMRDRGPIFSYKRIRSTESVADTTAKPVPRQQLENFVNILEQIAESARNFKNFKVTADTDVYEYVERISDSQSAISAMRKRLETVTNNQRSTTDEH